MHNRPYILIVDDDPSALAAMFEALARRFGGDYQVVSHRQGPAALAELKKIKRTEIRWRSS
jgi:CheY-like chemotaxis protein